MCMHNATLMLLTQNKNKSLNAQKATHNTSYGVFCENCQRNWPRFDGTTLYYWWPLHICNVYVQLFLPLFIALRIFCPWQITGSWCIPNALVMYWAVSHYLIEMNSVMVGGYFTFSNWNDLGTWFGYFQVPFTLIVTVAFSFMDGT